MSADYIFNNITITVMKALKLKIQNFQSHSVHKNVIKDNNKCDIIAYAEETLSTLHVKKHCSYRIVSICVAQGEHWAAESLP